MNHPNASYEKLLMGLPTAGIARAISDRPCQGAHHGRQRLPCHQDTTRRLLRRTDSTRRATHAHRRLWIARCRL